MPYPRDRAKWLAISGPQIWPVWATSTRSIFGIARRHVLVAAPGSGDFGKTAAAAATSVRAMQRTKDQLIQAQTKKEYGLAVAGSASLVQTRFHSINLTFEDL